LLRWKQRLLLGSQRVAASGDLLEETVAIYSKSDINPDMTGAFGTSRIYVGFAVNRAGFFEEITARPQRGGGSRYPPRFANLEYGIS